MNTPASYRVRLLTADTIVELAQAQRGRFFSLTFTKRDGSVRKMVCRLGVNRHLVNGGEHTGLGKPGLLTVYDVRAKGYRSVRLDSVMTMGAGGMRFVVAQPVGQAA